MSAETPVAIPAVIPNVVVAAGAGTGKTHALVSEYLLALLGLRGTRDEPKTPDRLLAITFTDKAAAEMRARVQARLWALSEALSKASDPAAVEALEPMVAARLEHLGRAWPSPSTLRQLRRALLHAPILTFHAFCARVLREHALIAGLDPEFALFEGGEEERLLLESAEAAVLDALARGDAGVTDLAARVPLRGFADRNGLVESLSQIHRTLGERGLDAATLRLATDDAASVDAALLQLRDAIRALRKDGGDKQASRAGQLEMAFAALQGAASNRQSADPEADIARAFGVVSEAIRGNWGGAALAEVRRALQAGLDAVGAALSDRTTAPLSPAVRALLVDVEQKIAREKAARGALGFTDLLLRTRALLWDEPSVRARVKQRFDLVLVDEYQDTSPAQEDIVGLLAEEPTRGQRLPPGARPFTALKRGVGRLFLVGDAKQSIYGFRGADASVFQRAQQDIAAGSASAPARDDSDDNADPREDDDTRGPAPGEVRTLNVSRRSTGAVVGVVNLVAAATLERGAFPTPFANSDRLVALRAGGSVEAGAWWRLPEDESARLPRSEREALALARGLRELLAPAAGDEHEHEHEQKSGAVHASDVAILVRRGRATVPVARALHRTGIACRVVGGDGFWARPEVSDLVCALLLAVDPDDELSTLAVLRSPLVAVPDDQLLALFEARPRPQGFGWALVAEAADDALVDREVAARIRAFDGLLQTMRRHLHDDGVPRCIDLLLDAGGYAAACAVEPDASLRLQNAEKLRALSQSSEAGSGRSRGGVGAVLRLGQLLDEQPAEPLASDDGAVDSGADAAVDRGVVRVMTIHQSKGLEFPVVILADAGASVRSETDDVLFDAAVGLAVTPRGRPIHRCTPKAQSDTPVAIQRVRKKKRERDESELARLLYVALTRARDRVYVTGSPRRAGGLSLLSLLEAARDADSAAFDALLPPRLIEPTLPPPLELATPASSSTAPSVDASSLTLPEPPVLATAAAPALIRRVPASALLTLSQGQPGLFGGAVADDDEGPASRGASGRRRGRLLHGLVAHVGATLQGGESPDDLTAALHRAGRALGVATLDDDTVARALATLRGPLAALVEQGAHLSFEEPVSLFVDDGQGGGCAVHGVADLVARLRARIVVVELKSSARAASSERTKVQLYAYAQALLSRPRTPQAGQAEDAEPRVDVAAWALGDAMAPAPHSYGKAQRAALARALAALVQ